MKATERRVRALERRLKAKKTNVLRILVKGEVVAEYTMKRRKADDRD